MKELISIIIPVYNVEKYLNECVESVVNQSYKRIEIILVDDGSVDNSGKMCDEWKKADKRIKVVHKKNGGLSDARNAGLEVMTGEYITFIDSDDIISKKYVEYLYKYLVKYKADISVCKFKRFNEKREIKEDFNNIEDQILMNSSEGYYLKTLYQLDHTINSVSSCAKLYKKRIFSNIRFDVGKINEDFLVIDKILANTKNVLVINKELYFYRFSENSITNSTFNNNKLYIIDHCKNLLAAEEDEAIKRALITTIYTRSIDLLTNMKESHYKNKEIKKSLWENIKKYRFNVLKNKSARKQVRLSSILSVFGNNVLSFSNVLLRKYKKKKGIQ